jgi:cytochrome P450
VSSLQELVASGKISFWFANTHAAASAVLRDPRFSSDFRNSESWQYRGEVSDGMKPIDDVIQNWMLSKDAPDHTRVRSLVNKAFTARRVEALRGHIQDVVDGLLDAVAPRGRMEVIADLAYPLPATIICELLGVPVAERDVFQGWARDLAPVLDFVGALDDETVSRMEAAAAPFVSYIRGLIDRRRREPGDDLLTALIEARDAGDRLSDDELLAATMLVLGAGFETTMNLIGNGTYLLLAHPEQLRKVRDDPSLVVGAVEEVLRLEGPVLLTSRVALEETDVGGVCAHARQQGVVMLAVANRDASVFTDPDSFDISRTPNPHLTFGGGPHFCPGAALARLEGQIALGSLVRRFPGMTLDAQPEWRATTVLHGLKAVHVSLR